MTSHPETNDHGETIRGSVNIPATLESVKADIEQYMAYRDHHKDPPQTYEIDIWPMKRSPDRIVASGYEDGHQVWEIQVNPKPLVLFVAVYFIDLVRGGSEEGGWYYEAGHPCEDEPELLAHTRTFSGYDIEATREQARAYRDEVEELIASWNKGRRCISSVLSAGKYYVLTTEALPAPFPKERPFYE